MATGAKGGLTPARTIGSGPDNKGIEEHEIANEYASNIFLGDPVKRAADGTIILATNGDKALGVFLGCVFTNSEGQPIDAKFWPASTDSATQPIARVLTDPQATFTVKADGAVTSLNKGDLLPYIFNNGSTLTGRAGGVADADTGNAGTSLLKVHKVTDEANQTLEVSLAKHEYRGDAA